LLRRLYLYQFRHNTIFKFNPDGTGQTSFATGLNAPKALAFNTSGNLFVTEGGTISKFNPDGTGKTVFATGLNDPRALAFDATGDLFVGEGTTILKFNSDGTGKTVFATEINAPSALAFAPDASTAPANPSTAVPETFTIIGTLIGGTAALRMRKKLKS
jgi:glucose/arabinose dehydrogenase